MTDTTERPALVVRTGDNPFGVDPRTDLLHAVPSDRPDWSETMYFHVWSPEDGVGFFVHTGRWPGDLDLWWAQTIALLPDGQLLVDRSWGRAADDRGPATGNLQISCEEPLRRWRLRFDGAGELTTRAKMAEGPIGAGAAKSLRFDVELQAAAPVWDMHGALGIEKAEIDNLSWANFHHTQGFTATGTLSTEGQRWDINGVAHRDHSSGHRDVGELGGLHFFVFVFPGVGRVVNGLVNWRTDGTVDHRVFTFQQDGACETGSSVRVTGLESYVTHEPKQLTVTLGREAGEYRMYAAWQQGYTLTFLAPNENLNGVDLRREPDAVVVTQSTVRVLAPDGEVGYGVIERDYRPSMLPSPQER